MLNVVRSAVVTSTRRVSCTGSPSCLDRISYRRQSSAGTVGEDTFLGQTNITQDPLSQPPSRIDKSKMPKINEDDLDERFISGSGPGGQNVNKATNCCQIRHRPTGIVVKCHQSRSLNQNRKIARELLQQKLDNLYNGENSVQSQAKRLALHKMQVRESQSEKRRAMKEQFKRTIKNDDE